MIRRRAQGPLDGLEFRGAEQARPTPAVLDAIAARRAIVIGPSNPLASIAPDPRRAGAARGAAPGVRAGRGRQPDRRRRGAEGPDRRLHGVRRARAAAPRACASTTASCSTGSSPTSRSDGSLPTLETDTRMDDAAGTPSARARRRATSRLAPGLRAAGGYAACSCAHRRDPARQELLPRQAAAGRERGRPAAPDAGRERWSATCSTRSPRPRRSR